MFFKVALYVHNILLVVVYREYAAYIEPFQKVDYAVYLNIWKENPATSMVYMRANNRF